MSNLDPTPQRNDETIDRDEWIDAACDRYEDRWLLGNGMSVEEFLCTEGHDPDQAAPSLVRELQRLYAHYASSDGTRMVPVAPESGSDPGVRPGAVLAGRYKLIERIGGGGMGEVWTARQLEPVRRVVAVKVIRDGRGGPAVLARFEAERQALAVMDHPNIAKVLDAGATDTGRPFFVMELVKGVPITQFCDARKLTPRQRLELFVPVCLAVQHAHQKGVIHRDLKPGNVLVALHDERPVPVVIDFGIAKATGDPLTELSMDTGFGTVVGTPEYMSPEQASLNQRDIDTRSDVYSLGVLLYELLTGTTPVDRKSLSDAMLLEVLRIVREVDAPRPSAKLSTSETLPAIAASRGTEPKRLARMYRGELDWVLLKALEKDRERRYPSALAFAADLQRHLADEVVEARPPTTSYKLRKFIRRNRPQVIAATLVFLTLLAGIIGTTLGLWEANRQKGEAESAQAATKAALDQLVDEEKKTRAALAMVTAEQLKTQSALEAEVEANKQTMEALRTTTDNGLRIFISQRPQLGYSEREYLERVRSLFQKFADYKGTSLIRTEFAAEGEFQVAKICEYLGDLPEAIAGYKSAIRRFELLAVAPAVSYQILSDLSSAYNNLGMQYRTQGKYSDAIAEFANAVRVRERSLTGRKDDNVGRLNLGKHYLNWGLCAWDDGKNADAEVQFTKALTALDPLRANDDGGEAQSTRALVHNGYAMVLEATGREARALEEYRTALGIQEKLAKRYPNEPHYQRELAQSHNNLGILRRNQGDLKGSLAHTEASIEIGQALTTNFPAVIDFAADLGGSYCNYARLLISAKRPDEALVQLRLAIEVLEAARKRASDNAVVRRFLRNSYGVRAQLHVTAGRFAEAVADWDRVVEFTPPPDRTPFTIFRAFARIRAGEVEKGVAEVEAILAAVDGTELQHYDFAVMFAVAASMSTPDQKKYADRAMDFLQKAVKADKNTVARMKTDKYLDALRERADFKNLLEGP